MITVEKKHSFMEIESIWSKLYYENDELSFYQSPEYMRLSWSSLKPYIFILNIRPLFYVFSKDSKVIFILPLFKHLFKSEYVLYGRKAGLGYLDGVYAKDIGEEDFTNCFDKLTDRLHGALISIEHVKEVTPLGKWFLKNGCQLSEEGYTEIPLTDDYKEYFMSLSKHMRQNIRSSYNRLKTDNGKCDYRSYDYKTMPDDLREELLNLYINRQTEKYGKSRLFGLFVKHVDIGTKIHKADQINEKAFILFINGKIAAYYDAIYAGDTVIVPRLAIAEGFERYSPGVMLINESIGSLIDGKITCLDLTHGDETYKVSLGGVVSRCVEGELRI